MTELEAIRERRSIRKYEEKPLSKDVVGKLMKMVEEINAEGNLHFQLIVNEPKAFKGIMAYGKFSGVSNYFMIMGPKSDSLDYRGGYYGEKLVIYAQQLGLRTCWVGLTYKKVSEAFQKNEDDKILCCIALGYGAEEGHIHKSKSLQQVSNVSADTPEWFEKGVEAALLAPTAVNQQKFRFEYIPAEGGGKPKVRAERVFSMVGYTKIDLGIAMYNFEVGAGKENFEWVDALYKG